MRNFRRFLHTTRDVFRIYWEIAPGLTSGYLITQILMQFQGLVTAYIFGLFIDLTIKVITVTRDVNQIVPVIVIYVAISLIFDMLSVLNNYFGSILAAVDVAKIRLKQTDFMVGLGISQTENPELTNKSTRFTEAYNSINQHLSKLVSLIAVVVSAVTYSIVIFSFAPVVTVAIVVFFVFKYLNNGRFITRIWKLQRDHTEERRGAWTSVGYLAEAANLKEVVLSGGVDFLRAKFVKFTDWYNFEFTKIRKTWAIFESLQIFIDTMLYGVGIYLLVKKTLSGFVTIGTFTFYLRSLGAFSDLFSNLSYNIGRVVESSYSSSRCT